MGLLPVTLKLAIKLQAYSLQGKHTCTNCKFISSYYISFQVFRLPVGLVSARNTRFN